MHRSRTLLDGAADDRLPPPAAAAPFKMTTTMHPDGPRLVLDPEPRTPEQKELALAFLQSVTVNLELANAQLGQQLVAEKHLRGGKEPARQHERTLLERISDLESEAARLKVQLDELRADLAEMKVQLDRLVRSEGKVTLREICRVLERHLCLQACLQQGSTAIEASGSYFNFAKVKGHKGMFRVLERGLQELGFCTSTDFIDKLKDEGNAVVHQNRDCPNIDELRARLRDRGDGDCQNSAAFVNALVSFGMVSPDGRIVITRDPLK
jgi:hypothetical protein